MAERIQTDLIVKAITEGFDRVGGDFKKIEQEQRKAGGAAKFLTENWVKMAAVIGTVTVAIGSMKKLYDFASEGAEIAQMGESWEMLLDKVGAAPDLLYDLQTASRGTISDMELMTSTATLLAGASGELGTELANASPILLEIAKAANKLNPALGSTAFMYESIATGVKRGSPMIIDNLGLILKVGDANEAMATKLGKSVDQLTAQEKSMAILNDTMRAGRVLIDQVGGNVDAMGDNLKRAEVRIKEASDRLKEWLFESIEPAIDRVMDFNDALDYLEGAAGYSVESFMFFERIVDETGETVARSEEEILALAESVRLAAEEAAAAAPEVEIVGDAAEYVGSRFDASYIAMRNASSALGDVAIAAGTAGESIDLNLTGSIGRFLDELAWLAGGGAEILAAFEVVKAGVLSGAFTPEEGQQYGAGLFVMATDLDVELGKISPKEAADKIRDQLGGSLQDSKDLLADVDKGLADLPKQIDILINIRTTGQIPSGIHQHGGTLVPGINIVGEAGPEMIIGRTVIPAGLTRQLIALGLIPGQGFQYGGEFGGAHQFPGSGYRPSPTASLLGAMDAPSPAGRAAQQIYQSVYGGGGATGGGGVIAVSPTAVGAPAVSESQQVAQITAEQVTAGVSSTLASTQAEQIVALRSTLLEQSKETKKQLAVLRTINESILDQGTMEDLGDIMAAAEE